MSLLEIRIDQTVEMNSVHYFVVNCIVIEYLHSVTVLRFLLCIVIEE